MNIKDVNKKQAGSLAFLSARYIPFSLELFMCLLISSCALKPTPRLTPTATPLLSPVAPTTTPTIAVPPSPSITPSPTSPPPVKHTRTPTPTNTPRPTHPAHSPLIAFTMMTRDGKRAVHTIHPDGTGLARLVPGPTSSYTHMWSPDGRKIAYLSGDTSETARITILDYESEQIQQVDFPGVTTFTWSPDGQRLAFTTEPETQGEYYYVYLVAVSDLKLVSLVKMWSGKRLVRLDWSPKGDKILAMSQFDRNPAMYLLVFSLSGEYTALDNRGVLVYDYSWDPTGEWIAFTGEKLPEWIDEMWVISAEGTQAQRLIENQDVFNISWSPDGKRLAYSSGCCGHPSGIFVIDLQTQAVQQIAPPEASAEVPSWSPDGAYLAFLTATKDIATKGYSLNVYSFATGTVTQIIKEMVDGGAAWRP